MKRIQTWNLFMGVIMILMSVIYSAEAQRIHNAPPTNSFAQALAAARHAGFPTHPNELQQPLPPPSQNAAPLYVRLTQLLKTKPLSPADKVADSGIGRQMPSPEKIAQIRRALQDRPEITALIHQAASRPQCVFVRDWARGPYVLFPEYAKMRSAARWLSAENAVQLANGKPLEALRTQALCFKIAHQAANEPTLISALVGVAIDAIGMAGMERILYVDGKDPKVVEAVAHTIAREHRPFTGRKALRGELAINLVSLSLLRKDGPSGFRQLAAFSKGQPLPPYNPSDLNSPSARKAYDRLVDANGAIFIQNLIQLARASERPYPQAKSSLRAITAGIERNKNNPAYLLTTTLFPVYDQAIEHNQASEARAAVVRAGAGVLAWKARHGAFPARLSEVLRSVPTDPFDGRPLRYRREGSGFAVYSVGPSGTFNGGTPDKKPGNLETVFRYPLPAYYRNK